MTAQFSILPIGPLMIEHRLIERMVNLLEKEALNIRNTGRANIIFLRAAIDFFIFYADRTHHGKEEDIFFAELLKRKLSAADKEMVEKLQQEHVAARELVVKLGIDVDESCRQGSPEILSKLSTDLGELIGLYRPHIQKEDKHFFIPVMKYFSKEEQDAMLCRFWEFDRLLIHEKYKRMAGQFEEKGR